MSDGPGFDIYWTGIIQIYFYILIIIFICCNHTIYARGLLMLMLIDMNVGSGCKLQEQKRLYDNHTETKPYMSC